MLRLPKNPLFPTLVFVKDVEFKKLQSGHKTGVYCLDWTKIEGIKHERWAEQFPCNPAPVTYCDCIPESQKKWVDGMQFLLSEEYLNEIRHCCFKAAEEWERNRPITKQGIVPVLHPAIAYIDTAFHLLADCLFDPETEYYSRSGIKMVTPFILTYRFWAYQTTFWNIKQWVNLPELLLLLDHIKKDKEDVHPFGVQVYEDLQKHLKSLEDNHYYQRIEKVGTPSEIDILNKFINNEVGSVTIHGRKIEIPNVGEIGLLYPVRLHHAKKKMTLTAEFNCSNMMKILPQLMEHNEIFDFALKGSSLVAKEAIIKGVSGTPPPTITIEFSYLTWASTVFDLQSKDSNEPLIKECGKINMQKIKESTEQDLAEADQPYRDLPQVE
jgi:hypothetical protein